MADPFASMRRKPAGATYGRKALAARRLARPETSPNSDRTSSHLHSSPAANIDTESSDVESESTGSEDGSDALQKRTRYGSRPAEAAGEATPRRTARSAIAKLELLYQDTNSPGRKYSSAREVLDSTKCSWDLGSDNIEIEGPAHGKPARRTKRVVRNNTDIFISVDKPGAKGSGRKSKAAGPRASTLDADLKPRSTTPPAAKAKPTPASKITGKVSKAAPKKRTQTLKRTQAAVSSDSVELEQQVPISANIGLGVDAHSVASDTTRESNAWDMVDLLSSSPLFSRTAGSKRTASDRQKRRSGKGSNLPSSSPPSTPGRLLDSSKGSGLPSSIGNSDSDSDEKPGSSIFRLETPKTQSISAFKGPSIATSKRLQSRAFAQNVVYKYGRARNEDEDDDLTAGFTRALGLPMLSEAAPRSLLESPDVGSSNDSINRPGASVHPLEHRDGGLDRSASTEPFKRLLSDILQGFNSPDAGTFDPACLRLLENLADSDFCEELLCDKQALSTLLRGIYRARKDPLVLSTTMLLMTLAFSRPTVMQMLVFERQALEMVAELLKLGLAPDLLSLRHRGSFETKAQHRCVAYICSIVRGCHLVGDTLPISTYNLALAALHGFTRKDDAAFLAMAPLLRGEMHESGCLGLIAERALVSSIPSFAGLQGLAPDVQPSVTGNAFEPSGDDTDDMWMDFDLPEERKDVASALAAATASAATSVRDRGQNDAGISIRPVKCVTDVLEREPDGTRQTSASIALELEILQFCATASAENQDEILANDSCVPMLLTLLAKSQQDASGLNLNASSVCALETVVLALQLLVNLANSSTKFSAQFVACDGLDIAAKNVAIVSQKLALPRKPGAGNVDFSPARKTLADEVGDLRYDILLVTSALLTNIVDSDPSCVLHIGHVRQDQQCRLAKRCFPRCLCESRLSLVVLLAKAFVSCHMNQVSADAAIAAGYLAVLLGFLMREPQSACRELIQKHLPRRDVAVVVEHIQKFMHVSDAVGKRFGGLLSGIGSPRKPRKAQHSIADSSMLMAGVETVAIPAPSLRSAASSTVNATLHSIISSLNSA
ncbi:hypothetical protein H4S02_001435 [Coemansia sp. RSA 2611]|nr:hypothetical protein H4S02_001435 [Coemansia sp. RSA 2611]